MKSKWVRISDCVAHRKNICEIYCSYCILSHKMYLSDHFQNSLMNSVLENALKMSFDYRDKKEIEISSIPCHFLNEKNPI